MSTPHFCQTLPPDSLTIGLCSCTPLGALPPEPRYRLTLRVLAMRVHPTFFDLVMPDGVGNEVY